MPARSVVFETEVGVVHRTFDTAFEAHAEEIGQSKILSLHAPFVVEARFVSDNQASPVFHESAELIALGVGKGGDIRQDESPERAEMRVVEQTVMHHLEWDARLDERLIPAEGVVLDFGPGAVAAIEPCGLLRIDERDAGERGFVAQVFFPAGVAAVDVLDHAQPTRVVEHAAEFGEPGTQAVGRAVGDPDSNFSLALHGVFPAIRFFDSDAEDADDGFAAHGRAKFLSVLAIGPRSGETAAGLAVGDERGRELADFRHVERTGRATSGVRDDAGVGIDLANLAVPELPQVEQPLLSPENISAAGGVQRIAGARQVVTRGDLKILQAVLAVTHAGAVPTIDENAVHSVARHDFLLHFGHELAVVRTQGAGNPHLWRGPVTTPVAIGLNRDPIRMRVAHVIVRGVRVGARDDDHAELAAAGDKFAERIGITEPLTAMVQRNFRRIIRDATAGTQTGGV